MSTIHSSPVHFVPPSAVGTMGQVLTLLDNIGTSGWQTATGGGLAPNGVQVFVSQIVGSDITGTGSYSAPFATINHALSTVASTSVPVTIEGIDGATYNEQIIVNNPLINFNFPLAILSYTGGGDAITYNSTQYNYFSFYLVQCSTGNAFVNNSTGGGIALVVGAFAEGSIINNSGSEMFIYSFFINGTINAVAHGPISYITQARTGSDLGGTIGTFSGGTNQNWNVGGNSTIAGAVQMTGFYYPTVDGADGDVMTTNGTGVFSMQPVSIPANAYQIYVSGLRGNDANNGSFTTPLQTIGAALTLAGSPSPSAPVVIFLYDASSYNEQVVIGASVENLFILGPTASINFSGTGDTLTISASAKLFIEVASVQNSGTGNAITNNGGSLFGNISIIQSASNAINNVNGDTLIVASIAIEGNNLLSAGNVIYNTLIRGGTDASGVVGTSFQGTSGGWNVATQLIAGGYNYPNGGTPTAGYVMTTDGSNNLSLQAPTGSGTVSSGLANYFAYYPANGNLVQDALVMAPTSGYVTTTIDTQAVTYSGLNSGNVTLLAPSSVTASYKITNIILNGVSGTNFAGGTQNVSITDGVTIYTVIPAATLQALVNNDWGSINVPWPTATSPNQPTIAGGALYATYSGGGADYTLSGSVVFTLVYTQVAY